MERETVPNSTLIVFIDHVITRIQQENVKILVAVERLGETIHSKRLASKGNMSLHDAVDECTDVPLLSACTEIFDPCPRSLG